MGKIKTYPGDRKKLPLFMLMNLIFTAYFYSTKETIRSNVVAASRGVIVKALAIFLIPAILGDGYVRYSATVAEAVTLIICLFFINYQKMVEYLF